MEKKIIVYVLSLIGMAFVVAFLNVITPEDNLLGIGIGNFIMKTIGYIAVIHKLEEVCFKK